MTRTILCAGKTVTLVLPDTGRVSCVAYAHAAVEDEAEAVFMRLIRPDIALAYIAVGDWNAELSPWPARRAFKGGDDFTGGADTQLRILVHSIVPAVEKELTYPPITRALVGYSLAGLFALYALYRTDVFGRIGCVSGSLWYDGFLAYMAARKPAVSGARAYLSLGDKEANARNPRLAGVGACTARARELLISQGADAVFEENPGNHFVDAPLRVAKAVNWLFDTGA